MNENEFARVRPSHLLRWKDEEKEIICFFLLTCDFLSFLILKGNVQKSNDNTFSIISISKQHIKVIITKKPAKILITAWAHRV